MIPFLTLTLGQDADAVHAAIDRVLQRGWFVLGPELAAFESEFAAASAAVHSVGVGTGTDALALALRALGIGPGDEVILPANTFIATAEAVSRIGAVPVLVDVDPEHLLIDPLLTEKAITARTKAIAPVHLFGQTAPMEKLLRGPSLPVHRTSSVCRSVD